MSTFDHPIFNPSQFRINTPKIQALESAITQLVWTGGSGASVLGFTRSGKTTALHYLADRIRSRSGAKVPVVYYAAHRRDKQTIRALYENISNRLRLPYLRSTKTEELASNLQTRLAEMAFASNSKHLVLAIDETQRLAIPQIDLFSELFDCLKDDFGVLVLCLFVGNQEQMHRLLEKVHTGANEHIAGRFFKQTLLFGGLSTLSDTKYCLNQYDTVPFGPENVSCTEYFMPAAYADGFRLVSLSDAIWQEYRLCRKELKISQWAMEYFTRAINTLLTDYLPKFGVDAFCGDMFAECIKVSGLYPTVMDDPHAQRNA